MAASLTIHILSDPMVFRDWPQYTETSKYYNKLPGLEYVTCVHPLNLSVQKQIE